MEALAASGSILRHGNLVYTRPNEIADALRRVLPIDVSSVKEALQRVEGDLSGLEAERSSIIGRARLRSKMVNYVFFTALAMQWGLLFRLTYWELSWDVIVSVLCHLSTTFKIVCSLSLSLHLIRCHWHITPHSTCCSVFRCRNRLVFLLVDFPL